MKLGGVGTSVVTRLSPVIARVIYATRLRYGRAGGRASYLRGRGFTPRDIRYDPTARKLVQITQKWGETILKEILLFLNDVVSHLDRKFDLDLWI